MFSESPLKENVAIRRDDLFPTRTMKLCGVKTCCGTFTGECLTRRDSSFRWVDYDLLDNTRPLLATFVCRDFPLSATITLSCRQPSLHVSISIGLIIHASKKYGRLTQNVTELEVAAFNNVFVNADKPVSKTRRSQWQDVLSVTFTAAR